MESTLGALVNSDDGALTPKEFQTKYRCGKTRMYGEINAGRLKAKKNGSSTLITNAREWLANLPDYEPAPKEAAATP